MSDNVECCHYCKRYRCVCGVNLRVDYGEDPRNWKLSYEEFERLKADQSTIQPTSPPEGLGEGGRGR